MRHLSSFAIMSMSIGFIGIIITSVLGIFWAPDVNPDQWRAPRPIESYSACSIRMDIFPSIHSPVCRILGWYLRRSESAWSLVQTGSDLDYCSALES